MLEIVFIEFLRCGDANDLIKVAVLRNFPAAQAHRRVLIQNISSHVFHIPRSLLRVSLNPESDAIVIELCVISPKEMAKTELE